MLYATGLLAATTADLFRVVEVAKVVPAARPSSAFVFVAATTAPSTASTGCRSPPRSASSTRRPPRGLPEPGGWVGRPLWGGEYAQAVLSSPRVTSALKRRCRLNTFRGRSRARWPALGDDARHGFATRELVQGHDHLTVAELMGRRDGPMLAMVYSHLGRDGTHLKHALAD
jgi:hypothetical protein